MKTLNVDSQALKEERLSLIIYIENDFDTPRSLLPGKYTVLFGILNKLDFAELRYLSASMTVIMNRYLKVKEVK